MRYERKVTSLHQKFTGSNEQKIHFFCLAVVEAVTELMQ